WSATGDAELAIIVTVVAVGAENTLPHQASLGAAIQFHHVSAQARLRKRTAGVMRDRMAGCRCSTELWNHVEWICRGNNPGGEIPVFRQNLFARAGAMAAQTVFILIDCRIQHRDSIRCTDPRNSRL